MMKLQYKEAAADCDAALALDDGLAKAYFRKGKALLAGGNPQGAMAAFTAGLIKDPTNTDAKADRKTAEEVLFSSVQFSEPVTVIQWSQGVLAGGWGWRW